MLFKEDIGKQKQLIENTIINGGIIIYPTDTLYGIGGRADSDEVVEKIYEIKRRDSKNPISVIIPDFNYLNTNFNITEENLKTIRSKLPGAYSFIIKPREEIDLSKKLNLERNKISIRICDHYIQDIVFSFGIPLISTSANFSGDKSPATINNISTELMREVDIVIIDDENVKGEQSKIVEL